MSSHLITLSFASAQKALGAPWTKALTVVLLFLLATILSRIIGTVAGRVVDLHNRRSALAVDFPSSERKRLETTIAMTRATSTLVLFAAAVFLSLAIVAGGFSKLSTLAGASFFAILLAFAFQRVLVDIIAGAAMFFEHWYSVGDMVVFAGLGLQGVVEDVSLRRTKLRAVNGEVISIHNSQIIGVSVLPRGIKRLAVEFFVSDEKLGKELVESVAQIVPISPTCFVSRPEIGETETLSADLCRIRIIAEVAPSREWLAEGFFVDLIRERAAKGLIIHGPVVFAVSESATRSFARAST